MTDQEARDELTLIARDVHLYDGGQTYALDGPGARRIADAILAAGYRKHPEPGRPTHVAVTVASRQSGKTLQMIDALLDRANERGVAVEIIESDTSEPDAAPAPAPLVDKRDPACVAVWPECHSFGYDPSCCRFPKSCSAGDWVPVGEGQS